MAEITPSQELPKTIEIFQGLYFERKYGKGVMPSVVIDVGEGDIFVAAAMPKLSGSYILAEIPNGITVDQIVNILGKVTLEEIIKAAERGSSQGVMFTDTTINTLRLASNKGSRILVRNP